MIVEGEVPMMEKICRSCMGENEHMQNLYGPGEGEDGQSLQLADMLMACTAVQVRTGDGLPCLLCIQCESKLRLAYEFKQQCEISDLKLRQINGTDASCEVKVEVNAFDDDVSLGSDDNDSFSDSEEESKPKKLKRSKNEMKLPRRTRKQSLSVTCHICQKTLSNSKLLEKHMQRHEKGETCEECNEIVSKEDFEKHMEEHKSAANAKCKCDECGLVYKRSSSLAKHKKDMHSKDADKDFDEEDDGEEEEDDDEFNVSKPKRKGREKGSFNCRYCSKVMTTSVGLKIHLRRHTGDDLYECSSCNKQFTKNSHLKRHMLTHGMSYEDIKKEKTKIEKKVMECEFCDRKFKYKKSFTHHMVEEHGMFEEDMPLNLLAVKDDEGEDLGKDDGSQDEAISSKDQEEDKQEEPQLSETNKLVKSQKSHVCHVCDANFPRANHLTRHMTLHRALLIYKCDRCEKAFASTDYLMKHMQEDHIDRPYMCTLCDKNFSRGEHLIRHLKVHAGNESQSEESKCSICEKTFTRSDHLARHIKIHLQQDKRHVCIECGKAFNRLDNLKTHQRIHSGDKDTSKVHLCVYCGKEFNNSSNMIVHMRRHTGERPYKCNQCGKGFPRSHDLKCHERTHSGEKPYLCTLCGKSFNKSNKLLRHTRVHTGERPYVCNLCGRAFTQSNDLSLHMRRHTGARPYACGVCPARFIQSGQLKSHRRSTGHWMEIQPDLKGGHRVEPVVPVGNPAPIKFKTHGKQRTMEEEEEVDEVKPQLLERSITVMAQVPVQPLMVENSRILEQFHSTTMVNLMASSLPEGAGETAAVKNDQQQGYAITNLKYEDGQELEKGQVAGAGATFQTTFSTVPPTSTTYTNTDAFNYQNYG